MNGPRRAVVVGGGLAGVSAAVVLAERGVAVTVLERDGHLGGRLGAWPDRLRDGEPFHMERGFHAFFRQYYNVRALLGRIDPLLRRLVPLADYPLLGPGGAAESFAGLPHTTPLNVLALVRRTPRLRLRDLPRVQVGAALEMLAYDRERTHRVLGRATARDYLDSLRVPADARRMLFEVFAHSFFNPEDGLAAGDLLEMFHFYFTGNLEGLLFDVLSEPFSVAVWEPLARLLESYGATIRLGRPATRVERRPGGGFRVHAAGDDPPEEADGLVLAVEVPALRALVEASADLGDARWRSQVARLDVTLPFAVWRLWLDRPLLPGRAPFAGTAGLGLLENVSLYGTFQGESRRWEERTGGAVVELHGYALPPLGEPAIREDLWRGLCAVYPEARAARIQEDRFLLRRDCPAFPPGSYADRPSVATPVAGLALAGDFVRLPFPAALMERAVASGFTAANQLLEPWGLPPERVWTVARRGLLAGMLGQVDRLRRGNGAGAGIPPRSSQVRSA